MDVYTQHGGASPQDWRGAEQELSTAFATVSQAVQLEADRRERALDEFDLPLLIQDSFLQCISQRISAAEVDTRLEEVREYLHSSSGIASLSKLLKAADYEGDIEQAVARLLADIERDFFCMRLESLSACVNTLFSPSVISGDIIAAERRFESLLYLYELRDDLGEVISLNQADNFRNHCNSLLRGYFRIGEYQISGVSLHKVGLQFIALDEYVRALEFYGFADWDAIEKETIQFGAKGAMLNALKKIAAIANEVGLEFSVPHFERIDSSVFRAYEAGADIDCALESVWSNFAGKKCIVRSSGVYAEDGAVLGAGIYISLGIESSTDFEAFKSAVVAVYESVYSDLAVAYRESFGIEKEEMGILVQEYVDLGSETYRRSIGHGYINTKRANIPAIMDVVFEQRYERYLDDSDLFTFESGDSNHFPLTRDKVITTSFFCEGESCLHLPSDQYRTIGSSDDALQLAKVALFLEGVLNKSLQIEFVVAGGTTHIVQARPLPKQWLKEKTVRLPEDDGYLWWGTSLGVIDEELPVLGNQNNSQSKGIVILSSSRLSSENEQWLDQLLPKEGAVLLLQPSARLCGHVESRALQRGLCIISGELAPNEFVREEYVARLWDAYGYEKETFFAESGAGPRVLSPNEQFGSVWVVSDGLQARVYTGRRG